MPLSFFILACSGIKGEEENSQETKESSVSIVNQPTNVKVIKVEQQTFNRELFANGKLHALHKANLSFRGQGLIQSVSIREGMRVQTG